MSEVRLPTGKCIVNGAWTNSAFTSRSVPRTRRLSVLSRLTMSAIRRSSSARSASVNNSRSPYLAGRCRGISTSLDQMPCRSGSPHGVFSAGDDLPATTGALFVAAGVRAPSRETALTPTKLPGEGGLLTRPIVTNRRAIAMAAPANSNLLRSFSLINMICAGSSLTKSRVSGFDRLILPPSAERDQRLRGAHGEPEFQGFQENLSAFDQERRPALVGIPLVA